MHFPNSTGRVINSSLIQTPVTQDLEPEYVAATCTTAFVSLQENNGFFAVIICA